MSDDTDSGDTGDPSDSAHPADVVDPSNLAAPAIDAMLAAYGLKDERRTGWQLRGVCDPESVAAHSWGVAYLVLAFGDRFRDELPGIDLDRALRLAVVHDVAEALTGDVATRADETADPVDREAKATAEREAMATLADPLPDRIADAFATYEARETPEAVLVKECDLLDTCVQAVAYEREDRYDPAAGEPGAFTEYDALDEFFATTERRLQTDAGYALFDRLRARYRQYRAAAGDETASADR